MTTTTTIEHISGKPYTVIRKPFDAEWVREQLAMGNKVLFEVDVPEMVAKYKGERYVFDKQGQFESSLRYPVYGTETIVMDIANCFKDDNLETLTILPPLPFHPTADDARLLYRYMAEGVAVVVRTEGCYSDDFGQPIPDDRWEGEIGLLGLLNNWDCTTPDKEPVEITHATTNGTPSPVAIIDEQGKLVGGGDA